jgi:hypothetical protein
LPPSGADAAGLGAGIANLPGPVLNFSNGTPDHNLAVGGEGGNDVFSDPLPLTLVMP